MTIERARHALAGGLLAATVGLAACDPKPVPPQTSSLPTRSVRVEHARLDVNATAEEVVGTVGARNSAAISSTVVGNIVTTSLVSGAWSRSPRSWPGLTPA